MEWPTAEIGLEGATGEESLAHEWRVEQLERLGLFLGLRGRVRRRVAWHAMEEVAREAADLSRLGATYQSPWGGFSRFQLGGIAKEASEGGMA